MDLILFDGIKNNFYSVHSMNLPLKTAKRLEALGMTYGTGIKILNRKKSALIVSIRGTRVALGRAVAENIKIEPQIINLGHGGKIK